MLIWSMKIANKRWWIYLWCVFVEGDDVFAMAVALFVPSK